MVAPPTPDRSHFNSVVKLPGARWGTFEPDFIYRSGISFSWAGPVIGCQDRLNRQWDLRLSHLTKSDD